MDLFKKKSTKKFITIYIIVFLVLFGFVNMFVGHEVLAIPTVVIESVPEVRTNILTKVWNIMTKIWDQAGAVAWKNAVKTFVGKIAYDTATELATGDHGGKSLFHQDTWKQYLDDAKNQAVGELLTEMFSGKGHCNTTTAKSCRSDADCPNKPGTAEAEKADLKELDKFFVDLFKDAKTEAEVAEVQQELKWQKDQIYKKYREKCEGVWSGIDVCEPQGVGVDALFKVQLLVGIGKEVQYNKPRCDWMRIKEAQGKTWENMQTFFNSLKQWDDYKYTLAGMFKPQQSDFGIWLTTQSNIKELASKTEIVARDQRQEGGGFKPLTDLVTGKIKTPAGVMENTLNNAMQRADIAEGSFTGEVVADAISIFTNTFMSKWLQTIFKKGLAPSQGGTGSQSVHQYSHGFTFGDNNATGLQHLEFLKPDYIMGAAEGVDILYDLVCTTQASVEYQSQNYCVIDEPFRRAISEKMTLGEAIKPISEGGTGWGNKYIGYFFDGSGGNLTLSEDKEIVSYRSLLILRKYRIVPVGLELAAQYINKFYKDTTAEYTPHDGVRGITLNNLINNYHNADSPFYHLVDPDWVLKSPKIFIRRQGPGEQIMFSQDIPSTVEGKDYQVVVSRASVPADEQNCVYEYADGTCGHWGYCVEERPIWRLRGNECEAKYKSCQIFVPDFDQGTKVSYLYDTVNRSTCDFSNYGCRAYCADWRLLNGEWGWDCAVDFSGDNWVYGDGTIDYLNVDDIQYYDRSSGSIDCSEIDSGCHEYIQLTHVIDGTLLSEEEWARIGDVTTGGYNSDYADDPIYLKKAPEYYSCEGYTKPIPLDSTDHINNCPDTPDSSDTFWRNDIGVCVESGVDECADYALNCESQDALCELFTPEIVDDEPAVPAVIRHRICDATGLNYSRNCGDDETQISIWNDECPEVCVGYKNYYKPATIFEEEEIDDPSVGEYLRLIASTGKECTQIGCDKFTNLDEVAKGGEGIEYFSYLRYCVRPDLSDPTQLTYYTWEGSDTTGYQLKRWELIGVAGDAPVTRDGSTTCDPLDSDCREFFRISGSNITTYWRYFSQTITVTENCHPYSHSLPETDGGTWCTTHRGEYNATTGQCTYMAFPDQGISCLAANAGCREYKSATSYNYRVVLNNNFEDQDNDGEADIDGWYRETNPPIGSRESAKKDNFSMFVNGEASIVLPQGSLEIGKNYRIVMVAKSVGPNRISAEFENEGDLILFEGVLPSSGIWARYELNLENIEGIDRDQGNNESLRLRGVFYLDEITVREVDSEYLIKNSWKTPAICGDRDVALSLSPDSLHTTYWTGTAADDMLGCESYRTSNNLIWYLRSFDRLCREELIGCQSLIDTQNTSDQLSDDEVVYLVNNDVGSCSSNVKGCTRLGLVGTYYGAEINDLDYKIETTYKIIDPGNTEVSCRSVTETNPAEYVDCEKYNLDEVGSSYNFKNPINRVCQWKTNANFSSIYRDAYFVTNKIPTSTWFLIDTDVVCPESSFCDRNNTNNPDDCLTMNCPSTESGCQEYVDPSHPTGCMTGSYPAWNLDACDHYYYKSVDKTGCDSQTVDPDEGCVGFYNEMTNNGEPTIISNCQPGCLYQPGPPVVYVNEDCVDVGIAKGKPGCVYGQ